MFRVSIPRITDMNIMKRYESIKPVITVDGKLHFFREFTFDEIVDECYLDKEILAEVGDELEVLKGREFYCLHDYGYPCAFKPTVGEVLSQIEEYGIEEIAAFEIIDGPEDYYKDMFKSVAFDNGYFVSTVRLYKKVEY